ncbi:MAG: hypothetical protein DRN49_04265, partial [Thaumarchaeota archaeon]
MNLLIKFLIICLMGSIFAFSFLFLNFEKNSCIHGHREEICIYAGSGAVLAGDVKYVLDKLGISYREVDEDFIKNGGLADCSTL